MYAPILRLLEKGTVTALMDPDQGRWTFMTQNYGDFDCYDDYGRFLAQADIDAVLVASPVYLHEEQVIQRRERANTSVRKPMAPTLRPATVCVKPPRRTMLTLMIGFVKRFDKSLQLAQDLIQAGRLGRSFISALEVSWCHDLSPLGFNWRQSLRALGGIFQDNASHIVDLCRWWLARFKVSAGRRRFLDRIGKSKRRLMPPCGMRMASFLPFMSAMYRKTDDGVFSLRGQRSGAGAALWSRNEVQLAGTVFRPSLGARPKQTDLTLFNYGNLDRELRERGPYKRQVDHFCEAILENKAPWIDGLTGRKAIEVVNAVYLASWQDTTIKLPLSASGDIERIFREMRMQYGG